MTATSVFIGVPSLGQIRSETMTSLMKLQYHLQDRGLTVMLQQYQSADIAMSRNVLASNFYWSRNFTHFLFIDADMSFEPEAIQRLLDFDQPVTAQICPRRVLDLDRLRGLIEADMALPAARRAATASLVARATDYAVRATNWDGTPAGSLQTGGFLSVPGLGAAILLIRRDALQIMIDRKAAVTVGTRAAKPGGHLRAILGFFSPLEDGSPDRPLAEDLSFCKRWVDGCGGQIWADTETPISHHGSWAFTGCYGALLARS